MPVRGNILYCPSCNRPQSQINFTNCEDCGTDLGAPNVNIVSAEDELTALQKRYDDARNYCTKNGIEDVLNRFEDFFTKNVKAVKNVSFEILSEWIAHSSAYKSYHRAVEEGLRPIANLSNDRKRTVIDSFLYGTYGRDLNFAALSLNDEGLQSYGGCVVILAEDSIKFRSSTLEENSYNFVKTHSINLETPDIPAGYRSTWNDKLKLAVAKIYERLTMGSGENDFSEYVLLSTGNTHTDEFIEVHIYKELTNLAVKIVYIPTPKTRLDALLAKAIESKLPGKVNKI